MCDDGNFILNALIILVVYNYSMLFSFVNHAKRFTNMRVSVTLYLKI